MNQFEKQIFDMYVQYGIGRNEDCAICRQNEPNLSKPISIWHVGTQYAQSKYKVLFIGKAARGSLGQENLYCDIVEDGTVIAEDLYYSTGWVFWNYTKAIMNKIYGEESAWEQFALTNMIKCNASETADTSTTAAKANCALFLKKEVELLQPKHIVFYTNSNYDEAIKIVFDGIEDSEYVDSPCGNKVLHLWNFIGLLGGNKIKVIRTGHPEPMNKQHFVKHIVDFITTEL